MLEKLLHFHPKFWDKQQSTTATVAGLATTDEMCKSFLGYYPAHETLRFCESMPDPVFGTGGAVQLCVGAPTLSPLIPMEYEPLPVVTCAHRGGGLCRCVCALWHGTRLIVAVLFVRLVLRSVSIFVHLTSRPLVSAAGRRVSRLREARTRSRATAADHVW